PSMPGIDLYRRTETGMQRQVAIRRIELEPDGQALYDLDPIARRILRGQYRELRAGSRRQACDVRLELAAAVGVDLDGGRLAGAHVGELVFLEIRFDPDVTRGNQGEDRSAGGNRVADLQLLDLRDDAVVGR